MHRRTALIAALPIIVLAAPFARAGAPSAPSRSAAPLLGPAVSGELAVVSGTSVWTDYAYDERSAAYPAGTDATADLVQLQLSLDRGSLRVTALVETLDPAHVPSLGLVLDTDDSSATGAAALPGGWTPRNSLGGELLLAVDGSGASVRRAVGGAWGPATAVTSQVDAGSQTLSATIPSGFIPKDRTIRAYAVMGPGGTAGGPVTDLAYVGGEPFANLQHQHTDEVLAGTRDLTGANIDLRELRRGSTSITPVSYGLHTVLYRSALDLGGGVRPYRTDAIQPLGGDVYLGPYQPYLLFVPHQVAHPTPLVMFLHGFGSTFLEDAPFFGPDGFDPPAVVAFPFGRGEGTYYAGIGEQDVYDVQADAQRRFAVDPDRVVLSGISMGGMGTFRLGQLHPDRWAALAPIINMSTMPLPEEQAAIGRRILPAELENLTNVPVRMVNGRVDPLANINPDKDVAHLLALGVDYRSVELLQRQHEVVPELQSCVLLDALAHRRVASPANITFSTQPAMEGGDVTQGVPQTYDHAWWLSEVRHRGAVTFDDKATVTATSLARPDRTTTRTPAADVGQNLAGPADPCRTPGAAAAGGDAWYVTGQAVGPGAPQSTSNALEATLVRIGAVTFDLPAMAIDATAPVTATLTGDGSTRLGLRGGWQRVPTVTVDGAQVLAQLDHGVLRLGLDLTGRHVVVVTP